MSEEVIFGELTGSVESVESEVNGFRCDEFVNEMTDFPVATVAKISPYTVQVECKNDQVLLELDTNIATFSCAGSGYYKTDNGNFLYKPLCYSKTFEDHDSSISSKEDHQDTENTEILEPEKLPTKFRFLPQYWMTEAQKEEYNKAKRTLLCFLKKYAIVASEHILKNGGWAQMKLQNTGINCE